MECLHRSENRMAGHATSDPPDRRYHPHRPPVTGPVLQNTSITQRHNLFESEVCQCNSRINAIAKASEFALQWSIKHERRFPRIRLCALFWRRPFHTEGPGMNPAQPTPATDSHSTRQLSNALTQVDHLVQQGCAEISSIAQLALAWLETPKGHRHMDVVARALQSIRDSAETLADYAGTEAQAMGCGFEDAAEMRRAEAAETAAKAMAQLFERRLVPGQDGSSG